MINNPNSYTESPKIKPEQKEQVIVFFDDNDNVKEYSKKLEEVWFKVQIYKFADSLIGRIKYSENPVDVIISEIIVQQSPSNNFEGKRKNFTANCAKLLVDELESNTIKKIVLTGRAFGGEGNSTENFFKQNQADPRFSKILSKKLTDDDPRNDEYPKKHQRSPDQLVRIVKKLLK